MTTIITKDMEQLRQRMKAHAHTGTFDGRQSNMHTFYFRQARQIHMPSGTSLLFTRDAGHHSSGYWKNPDYERCYHLSLSFWDLTGEIPVPRPFEEQTAEVWVRLFYRQNITYVWEEPMTEKLPGEVRHYRVFCDPKWYPIIPRKEVYSKDYTPAGWKSWSDRVYEGKL